MGVNPAGVTLPGGKLDGESMRFRMALASDSPFKLGR